MSTVPPSTAPADKRAPRPCPICGKAAVRAVRPFCSKRCADIDLHRWLGGHYAVPVVEEDASAPDAAEER